jgi:hypothetical protein
MTTLPPGEHRASLELYEQASARSVRVISPLAARAIRLAAEAMFPALKPRAAVPTCETLVTLPMLRGLLATGSVHTHHDGKWRYSPHGPDGTVYIGDLTKLFPLLAECGNGIKVWADPESGIYLRQYGDGTSGAAIWDSKTQRLLFQLYAPRNQGEVTMRAFLLATFDGEGA